MRIDDRDGTGVTASGGTTIEGFPKTLKTPRDTRRIYQTRVIMLEGKELVAGTQGRVVKVRPAVKGLSSAA